GAGITTFLMLAAVALIGREEKAPKRRPVAALLIVAATGAALLYATADFPPLGAADNPVQVHVAPRYIASSLEETRVPNMVTAVLASYRGYDTLGETTVIFTAACGVLVLLGRTRRRKPEGRNGGREAGDRQTAAGDGEAAE
ncbi:MAG: hydrogen gas-evolving membrane-bound hydrogenase subunit E, partial [Alphaproteobacteria bacterium]